MTTDRIARTQEVDGTHLQGYITATYAELVRVFGEPDEGCDGKTRAEWGLRFPEGTIATIYDWKSDLPVQSVSQWNVGGHFARAVQHVENALYLGWKASAYK